MCSHTLVWLECDLCSGISGLQGGGCGRVGCMLGFNALVVLFLDIPFFCAAFLRLPAKLHVDFHNLQGSA